MCSCVLLGEIRKLVQSLFNPIILECVFYFMYRYIMLVSWSCWIYPVGYMLLQASDNKAASTSFPLHAALSLFLFFNSCQPLSFLLSPSSPSGYRCQGRASNCMKGIANAGYRQLSENNDCAVKKCLYALARAQKLQFRSSQESILSFVFHTRGDIAVCKAVKVMILYLCW